jgi:N-methylhydantoinase A/oxoprolinase/acetone carboxylase beta subunit
MIIGLDVGGTHTDVVLIDERGIIREIKVPTDASNLFKTVLKGLESITQGIDPDKIRRVVLSTTLTTNAIVQDKVPVVGMIVSSGPGINPEYFRTNEHYFPVSGSIDHRGREILPVDATEIETVSQTLRSRGIRHVGIVGKFSVRNPKHENQIHAILEASFEKIFLGHQLSGHLNFPRRIATTFLNASVYPIHNEFFQAVKQSLQSKGLDSPIRILKADGGNMRFESSVDIPGQTILSGPAASVMGAVAFAAADTETLVLDIGGTTTDMTILINGVPILAPLGITIGSHNTLIRSLDTQSIGIGGDSQVRLSEKEILIGPQRLGPAMAFGGSVPTPTDALFIMNKMQTGDREKSIQGIRPMAMALGISIEQTAERIFSRACEQILLAAQNLVDRLNRKPVYTIHEMQEGIRLNPSDILILGGPAPFFAERFKTLTKQNIRVVPRWAVANAMGAALARTTCEVSLFADTEAGKMISPGEDYQASIPSDFDQADAVRTGFQLLKEKAVKKGANAAHLDMEVLEAQSFNMVRGFQTTGKNIRIRTQVKPGLIRGYKGILKIGENSG